MLSLPNDGRYPTLELDPQQRRQKTLEALTAQLEALAQAKPVLMIFEDVHWIDPTSLEAVGRTVDRLRTLGVLLIVTYRPEFEPPWIGRPYVTALTLNRLGEREITAMIDRVTGNKALPESIRQDIIERTDGVPLFVEEMTKAVLEAESEGEARRTSRRCSIAGIGRSGEPARFVDGAARPAWPGQGGGTDRRSDWARVLACPAGCGSAQARNRTRIGARPSHRSRFTVPAGRAAPCDLSVQARACAGCGLRHAAARAATRAARSHRRNPRKPVRQTLLKISQNCLRVTAPRQG